MILKLRISLLLLCTLLCLLFGQPVAGKMNGGDYAVSGGFWSRFIGWLYELFLLLIMR